MPKTRPIAIVEDDPGQRQLLDNALRTAGYETVLCATGPEGLSAAPQAAVVLLDVRLPGMNGLEVLQHLKADHPEIPVILLTAFIDVRDAVAAIKAGAVDYLEKPVDLDELIAAVDDLLGPREDQNDAFGLPPDVVAESDAMRDVFLQAARVAATDAAVLVLGESGAGKEVVARYIHGRSDRAAKPFVAVDCGALPENLIESELFGHERGAFTGADVQRRGRFEEADGATMFLDEVGELPLSLQPKFLRVLETGVFRRVGGTAELRTDTRLIAATNRDLAQEVAQGNFREDLYYRLNVFTITVPPLRERADDILPLADRILSPNKKRIAPATERTLMTYDWPGNVRELRNALERAAIMASGSLIMPGDLPPQVQQAPQRPTEGTVLVGDMKEIQRRAILEALEKTKGNKTRAAQLLGISRRNLIYKLRDLSV